MRTTLLLSVALGLWACDDDPAATTADAAPADQGFDMAGPDATVVAYDAPPQPDWEALPLARTDDGRVLVLSLNGASLTVRPEAVTPAARAGRCVYTWSACMEAAGDADACMRSVPRCADPAYADPETPLCCPEACVTAYQQARAAGTPVKAALKATLLGEGSCLPGVVAHHAEGGAE